MLGGAVVGISGLHSGVMMSCPAQSGPIRHGGHRHCSMLSTSHLPVGHAAQFNWHLL